MGGLDEIELMSEEEIPILQMFEALPCPRVTTSCEFWFREPGLTVFLPGIVSVMQAIQPYNWSLLVAEVTVGDLNGALYSDNLQAAWPSGHFKAEYGEVKSIEMGANRTACIIHTGTQPMPAGIRVQK